MVVYSEPSGICNNNSCNKTLGEVTKDYSSGMNDRLKYSDYRIAHSDAESPKDSFKPKNQSFAQYNLERKNIPKYTQEELNAFQQQKQRQEQEETERMYRVYQDDQRIASNYKKIQHQLGSFSSKQRRR